MPRPTARKRGYDRAWDKLRARHIARHPRCEWPGCTEIAKVVDHKRPVRLFPHLRLDPTNLMSLCVKHHSSDKQRHERAGYKQINRATVLKPMRFDRNGYPLPK